MKHRIALVFVVITVLLTTNPPQVFAQDSAPSTVAPMDRGPSPASLFVQTSREPQAAVGSATTTCAATYSSGSGDTATTYCVTANGTVPQFSRAGNEMINVGVVDEGYGICDFTTNTAYFDYSFEDSGNWLPATFTTPTAHQAVSTRITSDGVWQITNTITSTPATSLSAGKATVKMAVKNLTGITRSAYVLRHADVDADASTGNNDFDWTINTVTGQYSTGSGESFGYGLQLVNQTFIGFPTGHHNEYALNNCCAPNPCSPFVNVSIQPFHGDGSEMALYGATWTRNSSKTITVAYVPE
jgi:hypothetical protein